MTRMTSMLETQKDDVVSKWINVHGREETRINVTNVTLKIIH